MRAFIAIDLSDAIRQALGRLRDRVSLPGTVRWVRSEGIHLTLKFLGEIDPLMIPDVTGAMARAGAAVPPFIFRVGGFGCFPGPRNPRVFWVGVRTDGPSLAALKKNLDDELGPLGFGRESRAFKPHLTLARIKGRIGTFPLDLFSRGESGGGGEAEERVIGEQDAEEFVLFQSELKPSGAIYVPLATVLLGGT